MLSGASKLNVYRLSVYMLSVYMLSVYMLSVYMLSALMLNVVILCAAAPSTCQKQNFVKFANDTRVFVCCKNAQQAVIHLFRFTSTSSNKNTFSKTTF